MSERYRAFFYENIPNDLKAKGIENNPLKSSAGTLLCSGFLRIVTGDYGSFVEFSLGQANLPAFIVQPGQEYRIDDPKYSVNVKYHWYTIPDGSEIKIYKQQRKVPYADYLPGMFYVSVHEVAA